MGYPQGIFENLDWLKKKYKQLCCAIQNAVPYKSYVAVIKPTPETPNVIFNNTGLSLTWFYDTIPNTITAILTEVDHTKVIAFAELGFTGSNNFIGSVEILDSGSNTMIVIQMLNTSAGINVELPVNVEIRIYS